nr:MAG TPA: hypothetical protein [Bacteriophage sp.]
MSKHVPAKCFIYKNLLQLDFFGYLEDIGFKGI